MDTDKHLSSAQTAAEETRQAWLKREQETHEIVASSMRAKAILGTVLKEPAVRKGQPICTGVLDYFPDALRAVAECSRIGNEQHNPGEPLHWAKEKSTDEADALVRHLLDRGTRDSDGIRHSAKVAWRALAMLQREIEGEA